MHTRGFGRQLTNLHDPDRLRRPRNCSLLPHDKPKDPKTTNSSRPRSTAPSRQPQSSTLDPQMVPTYLEQSLSHMLSIQSSTTPTNYLPRHPTVNEQARAKLIDWLCELHYRFGMSPETLFTTTSLLDRYLSRRPVRLSDLQLAGAASLLIAAKVEETYQVPHIKQLLNACAGQYSAADLIREEADILAEVGFGLQVESSYKFYAPLAKTTAMEAKDRHLGQYVLELALSKASLLQYQPSHLASACLYLIRKIRKSEGPWNQTLTKLMGYTENELKACAKELCGLLEEAAHMDNVKAVRKKFSLAAYSEVARIKLQRRESRK